MGLWDSCPDGSLWVPFPSFWIFFICYIIYLDLRRLRSMSRPQHNGAWVSPKLLKTDIAIIWTSIFLYSAIITTLTPIQKRMYSLKKTQTTYVKLNICIKHIEVASFRAQLEQNKVFLWYISSYMYHIFHHIFSHQCHIKTELQKNTLGIEWNIIPDHFQDSYTLPLNFLLI